jgi:hypothetical protein
MPLAYHLHGRGALGLPWVLEGGLPKGGAVVAGRKFPKGDRKGGGGEGGGGRGCWGCSEYGVEVKGIALQDEDRVLNTS